jgi:hypothetical protein
MRQRRRLRMRMMLMLLKLAALDENTGFRLGARAWREGRRGGEGRG